MHLKNMYLQQYDQTVMNYQRNALFTQTLQFGPHIVFDCQWEGMLQHREVADTAEQFIYICGIKRFKKEDFIFPYFCNFKRGGRFEQELKLRTAMTDLDQMKCIITESSYLDIFSRKNLVYLSPNSPNIYIHNPNDVCVIGGLVDRSTTENLSYACAKEHGIRHARLPLKEYFR